MVHGKNRIPYWIDRRLSGLVGPDYDATISFGLPIEPGDCPYGKYRVSPLPLVTLAKGLPEGSVKPLVFTMGQSINWCVHRTIRQLVCVENARHPLPAIDLSVG